MGDVTDWVRRPIKPKPLDRTAYKKIMEFSTFVIGRSPADSKIDTGGEIVAAPIAPRVGCYLAGGDPPPSNTFFYEGMKRKPKIDLQSIHRDAHPEQVQIIGTLPVPRHM
ncbi:hypothetical protein B296_00048303 [Ensete ventricosum]|uniref:Uncharacterized protein n=1 Tax=Ensete ventricosum TaxID=4639 RepID=A0A426X308_ENSVE|nr:hypothetical protein B296_00048303 [Ensete ventricosum]